MINNNLSKSALEQCLQVEKIAYVDDSDENGETNSFLKFQNDFKNFKKKSSQNFNRSNISKFLNYPKKTERTVSLDSYEQKIRNTLTNNKRVVINVGGVRFETYRETLKLLSETRLANLSKTNSDYDPVMNEFFFDRDPSSFSAILNYYRSGELHVPLDVCGNQFYEELCFWGIGERYIQPCCWTSYSIKRDCDEILKKVVVEAEEEIEYFFDSNEDKVPAFSNITNKDSVIKFPRENKRNWLISILGKFYFRLRPSVWKFLDDRNSSTAAKVFFWISVFVLVTSLMNFIMKTSSIGRIPYEISSNSSMSRRMRDSLTVPNPMLVKIELFCNIFFTIEFLLRFFSSPDKLKFVFNLYNVLEFLAISPLFWPAETTSNKNSLSVKIHNYIEVFYILRILRIFTLVPKYSGLRVLLLTLKNSIGELVLYFLMLVMALMLFASFIFYAEQIFETEDNKFDSILICLWWAIVTMTTLGYGDIVPVTPFGYVIGGMCALCGLIFLALPIPVIVNNFTTFYAHAKAREKLKEYSELRTKLPNRAIAMHFHSKDVKSNMNYSFSNVNNLQRDRRNINERLQRNSLLPNLSEFNYKIKDMNSIENLAMKIQAEKKPLKKSKNKNRNHDAKILEKWKNSKRRTIRRNALVDFATFDTLINRSKVSLNSSLSDFYV